MNDSRRMLQPTEVDGGVKSGIAGLFTPGLVVIFALLTTNGLLVYQNFTLKRQMASQSVQVHQLRRGDSIPALRVRDKDTFVETSLRGQQRTLLLVLSPLCPACEKAVPYWADLAKRSDANDIRVVALVLADKARAETDKYRAAFGPFSTVLSDPDPTTLEGYGFNKVPQTILVSPQGKVEHISIGTPDATAASVLNKLIAGRSSAADIRDCTGCVQ